MKALNEVIEEEKAELRKKWPPFEVEGDHEQYSEGIFVSDIESLEDHLTQAMKKAALAAEEINREEIATWIEEMNTPSSNAMAVAVRQEIIDILRRLKRPATLREQLTDKE